MLKGDKTWTEIEAAQSCKAQASESIMEALRDRQTDALLEGY